MITVRFTRLSDLVAIPTRAREGDAAVDLASAEEFSLAPGERYAVHTGIAVEIPPGYAGFVFSRSGHAYRTGVSFANSVGVIDSGYRGEILVALVNHSDRKVDFARADRIAQLVILPIPDVEFVEVAELATSERGTGGYGSTGR